MGGSTTREVPFLSSEEIRTLLTMGEQSGALKDDQRKMIHSIFEMGDMHVRQAMVPRTEMVCLSVQTPVEEIMRQAVELGYSRIPVYKGDVDTIVGILYSKDLLHLFDHKDLIIIQDVLRQPFFVPATKKVSELLKEFQRGKFHMAIVVNEFGGTEGLVTLEDLIEEIVGEIRDEYDPQVKQIERLSDGSAIVDAAMGIGEVNQTLGVGLPLSEETTTLAGFIVQIAGAVPREGQKIQHDNLLIQVLKADRRRVEIVKITPIKTAEAVVELSKEAGLVQRRRKKKKVDPST
jgi:CBS domain containing-hemolysin-like protein